MRGQPLRCSRSVRGTEERRPSLGHLARITWGPPAIDDFRCRLELTRVSLQLLEANPMELMYTARNPHDDLVGQSLAWGGEDGEDGPGEWPQVATGGQGRQGPRGPWMRRKGGLESGSDDAEVAHLVATAIRHLDKNRDVLPRALLDNAASLTPRGAADTLELLPVNICYPGTVALFRQKLQVCDHDAAAVVLKRSAAKPRVNLAALHLGWDAQVAEQGDGRGSR
eukprot:47237-Pyramimonas_sp.AAC.1